jgi:amidophosphoribosyltransferase
MRDLKVKMKLSPIRNLIKGKRLIVVDDSIVRGNTQRALIRMLREAGAVEVHVRIASPPVRWPCFYGIDFATPAELIANGAEDEDQMLDAVRRAIGADTLGYISQQGMIAATEQPASRLCSACFDGVYPIELPGESALGKNVIEHMLATAARSGIPLEKVDNDNASALRRP